MLSPAPRRAVPSGPSQFYRCSSVAMMFSVGVNRAHGKFHDFRSSGSGLLWPYFFWPISIAMFWLGMAFGSNLGSCGLNTPMASPPPPAMIDPYGRGGSGPLACSPASCSAETKPLASALSDSEAKGSIRMLRPDRPILRLCPENFRDHPGMEPKAFKSSLPYVHISPSPLTETMYNRMSRPLHRTNDLWIRSLCAGVTCRSATLRADSAALAFASAASCRISVNSILASEASAFAEAMSRANAFASCCAARATDSAALAVSLAFPDSNLAVSATSAADFALSRADVESLRALVAFFCSASISAPSSFCKWWENTKTPPSAISSPARLTATIISNISFGQRIHCGSLLWSSRYSPRAPKNNSAPETSKTISDMSSAMLVAASDIENKDKKYPISPYTLAGGIGIALAGVALAILYLSVKHPSKQRSDSGDDASNKGGVDASR